MREFVAEYSQKHPSIQTVYRAEKWKSRAFNLIHQLPILYNVLFFTIELQETANANSHSDFLTLADWINK